MKPLVILILSLCIACNSITDQGFTDKNEAKNQMVNGLKEGKWIEYRDSSFNNTTESKSLYYALINYKGGSPYGISREYYKTGQLQCEIPRHNWQVNGVMKLYFISGKLQQEIPYKDDKVDGIEKVYYENGQVKTEIPYTADKKNGLMKQYYENGILEAIAPYTNGKLNGVGEG